MPHTGVTLMVIVGVSLGALLYYMFADNPHQYGNEGGGHSSPPPEGPDSWTHSENDNKTRRRKRGSSVSTGKASCTICLFDLAHKESVLLPCRHEFHKACIAKWREQGPSEARHRCPNCREGISSLDESCSVSSAWD